MNNNLERILKEQLENYEMPYESGAWEQFSKRLDGTPPTPFYRKWWFAAAVGTVLVGSATYFSLSSNERADQQQQSAVTLSASESANNTSETGTNAAATGTDRIQTQTGNSTSPVTPESGEPFVTAKQNHPAPDKAIVFPTTADPFPAVSPTATAPAVNPGTAKAADHFVKPLLPTAICLNEEFTLENPNNEALRVVFPNGKSKTVSGKQSLEIRCNQVGTIVVETGRSTETITVNEPVNQLYVDVDPSFLYENGIPTLKFDVSGTQNTVSWESNIAAHSTEKNRIIVHPYTEREVTVKAITTDQNGCPVTETKSVKLEQAYNLMAPTGFNPSSGDVRTNTFMPFALTMRETPFEMTIMDPNNMTVLFRSSDASQGWNGSDGRNGQTVKAGTTWLWKVVMKNPLPGEPKEYKGLITLTGN